MMLAWVWNAALSAVKKPTADIMSKIRIPAVIYAILMFAFGSIN